jgi:hypothetical protein
MTCKRCGANIPLAENATEGKCKFCGKTQKVISAEEENLDALIAVKQASFDDFSQKLKGKTEERAMLKKTLTLAIEVIVVFLIFLLSWHLGSERRFRRSQVILIFVSIFVIPGFLVGYLGGIVLAFHLAKQTSRAPHSAIVFAICSFNAYSVYMAIHFIFHSNLKRVKKEIDGLTKMKDDVKKELDELIKRRKALNL